MSVTKNGASVTNTTKNGTPADVTPQSQAKNSNLKTLNNTSLKTESHLADRLELILSQEFIVKRGVEIRGIYNKKIRPDISVFCKYSSRLLFHIECKDDRYKNFYWPELLRQSINYRHGHLNGEYPICVFAATWSSLSGGFKIKKEHQPMLGLANKLNVGVIYLGGDKILRFKVGSNIWMKFDINCSEFIEINFNGASTKIGSKSKSNTLNLNT